MRQNLLETYGKQINVAEAYIQKNFGKDVSSNTKLTTAVLLDNTNRWITECLNESVATSRSDLGAWKKFCLNLTNIAVPSLIANDLVIVHPMTAYSGSVAYLKYVALTEKGGVNVGDEFNSVFAMGKMTDARANYTSQVIVEAFTGGPVSLEIINGGMKYEDNGAIVGKNYKLIAADGYSQFSDTLDAKIGPSGDKDVVKVAYVAKLFQMETVPAQDIPTIGPKMEHIALVAEPRRIAVKYDQITAFQA